jgi:RHS repeat-associated protein
VSYGIDGKGYRYGFNGKENDNEIKGEGNEQDYGMRVYDPRAARFLSVDPITYQYPELTPYQFASNRPIDGIDQDGLEWMQSIPNSIKWKAQIKIAYAKQVYYQNYPTIKPYVPNWADNWKAWNDKQSSTHTWAILSRLAYNSANDAKITITTVVDGKNHASGLDNSGVSDYKERVGAGINTLSTVVLFAVSAEVKAAMSIPQGITAEEFKNASVFLREEVGEISNDIVVQGSRASHTAKPTSDIDIAIKVDSKKFDELISEAFGSPNPGSARYKTMEHAIKSGKITTGDAGLRGVKKKLAEMLNMKVDLSIIKKGGAFDNGVQLPIKK